MTKLHKQLTALVAFVSVIGLAQCGGSSYSSHIDFKMLNQQPVVITAPLTLSIAPPPDAPAGTLPTTVTVSANWFQFSTEIDNNSTEPLTVVNLSFTLTGYDINNVYQTATATLDVGTDCSAGSVATSTVLATGTTASGTETITGVTITDGIAIMAGMSVSGTGIPLNTAVTLVTGAGPFNVTINQPATATGAANDLVFTPVSSRAYLAVIPPSGQYTHLTDPNQCNADTAAGGLPYEVFYVGNLDSNVINWEVQAQGEGWFSDPVTDEPNERLTMYSYFVTQ